MSLPERALRLSGATNFRDLGGYTGLGGRPLQWRKLFRSDHLGQLSHSDVSQLAALGLARVCDFRGVQERQLHPCALPGAAVHALSIEPTVVQALEDFAVRNGVVTGADAARLMQDTYRAFVTSNSARFAELFDHLLHDDTPLVFHCTAGKDRTGFAAALVLSALAALRLAGLLAQEWHDLTMARRARGIGGGVGGCSILYWLARLGWDDVVLVERADLHRDLRRVPQVRTAAPVVKVLHLGEVRYDPERGELWRGTDLIRLTATDSQNLTNKNVSTFTSTNQFVEAQNILRPRWHHSQRPQVD